MQLLISAAAFLGPPPFVSFFAPAAISAGNAQDLWLVIGLLLLGILAGSGILFLLTAGLDRAEKRLFAAPVRDVTKALPQKAPADKTHPSQKSPWP